MLRALLAEGWDIDYVRVSDPHAAAILNEGLLALDQVLPMEPGDTADRIVIVTPGATWQAVVPA